MMGFNWVDWVLLTLAGLNGISGWREGFSRIVADLIIFAGVLWLALKYHTPAGNFVADKFGIPEIWNVAAGYLAVWIVGEIGLSILVNLLFSKIPGWISRSTINRGLGAVVAAVKAVAIAALGILVIVSLPITGNIKSDIRESVIGSELLFMAEKYGGEVKTTVNQAAARVVKFMTIKPESGESLALPIGDECKYEVDTTAEAEMLADVNKRRLDVGVKLLKSDTSIQAVARKHSQDMFDRKYFSHQSPEGTDAGDRLTADGVKYEAAGENIAYAPDTPTANQGLYDSEGHRRNMLDGQFSRVGVGVINGGGCGMMFTQNFAD